MPSPSRVATVLCVDDEALGLEIRRIILERQGYSVLTATEGDRAISLFRDHQVDAVVLDYAMPGMNGGEVAKAMRAIAPQVPIMLLSAHLTLPPDVTGMVDMVMNKGDGAAPLLGRLRELLTAGRQES